MFTMHMISSAISPITHMYGVSGNTALLKRESIVAHDGNIVRVPFISGNSIRHSMVRVPAAEFLFWTIGLDSVPYQIADFFWHGGKLTKSTPLTTAKTKEFIDAIPMVGLLGGAMPGQIIEGALRASRALLVCRETEQIISDMSGICVSQKTGCESYISPYVYTRSSPCNNPDAVANRMLYEGETVIAGSRFYHKFMVDSEDPRVIGCLVHTMRSFPKFVGGMVRIGHGELKIEWSCDGVDKSIEDELANLYAEHVSSTAEHVKTILHDVFGTSSDRSEKSRTATSAKSKKSGKKNSPESENCDELPDWDD